MRLRTRGHDYELPTFKYDFNKRNFIVRSVFHYVLFFSFYCRGVIIPTPLVEFSERSLYRACIAFLWGAMAISKNEIHSAISAPIGLKFCIRLEDDNTQIRARRNFEFPLKNLAPF